MVDYNELRRRFRPKNPELARQRSESRAAAKRIAREYERKRLDAGLHARGISRTKAYYAVIVLVMAVMAITFIGLATGNLHLGKRRISKADLQARQSIDALTIALARYKFHVGEYPSTEEGLNALAAITPGKRGWAGPYIKKVVDDPWGRPYEYWTRDEGGDPVLLSRGPDRKLGTSDDVLPDGKLFGEPFRDTTWTNHWLPYTLRGIVVAPDEKTRAALRAEIESY